MIQRVLHIILKVILGILLFILVTGFVIIPFVLTWAIPSQGSKFLKTPVHLHSAGFNPFILQLTLNDLEILDNQDRLVAGFDKLIVRVSFIDLLKKVYHVEAIELDGLKINVELLPGNKINLLELVPKELRAPKSSAALSATPAPLPVVLIDTIDLHQGQVHFVDTTINPRFLSVLSAIEINVTHVTTDPAGESKVKFNANLDERGRISAETFIRPLETPLEMETTFSLNDYALGVLTPYVGKYTGRELKNGQLDMTMDYRIGDNKLTASHKVVIQQFEFGHLVESKDALHLPFGLAVALLEDSSGKIKISLPATGNMNDPKFDYSRLITQVIHNFFINLVTKPFSFLAATLGPSENGTDELGYVRFSAGTAFLTVSQQQKLTSLILSLRGHPKLKLEIDGSYDPQLDWKTMQSATFFRDYEQLRKESDRSEGKVYQLLYQRRFGLRALWALAKKYKKGFGSYDDVKLDEEIKRQLIENAPPDKEALSSLAQARALLIHDFLVVNGFDANRMSIGNPQSTSGSVGYVPTSFTLTVFDS